MISICIKENNKSLQNYLVNEIKKSNIDTIQYSQHSFKIYENLIIHYKGNNEEVFFNFLAKILSNAIIRFYESIKIKRLIHFNYFYFTKSEQNIIFDEYKILIKKSSKEDKNFKLNLVYESLYNYLKSNKAIIIEGFVNFRLQSYIAFLCELLQEAVNQFLIDREYIEFVNLLKEYVESKVPKENTINLIYINSQAILLSQDGNIIDLEQFDSKYLSDISFCNNDYVLNTLVGLLPNKIILHLITPKDNFIKTIELIFGNKVKACKGCDLCSAYKMLNLNS